jgi:hypothetical protein
LYSSFVLLNIGVVTGWKIRWIVDRSVRSVLGKPEGRYVDVTKIKKNVFNRNIA